MTDEIPAREDDDPADNGEPEERGSHPIDVVDGPIGSASLREPSVVEREGLGADPDELPTPD
jgi:hypothetical protein